MKTSSKQTRSAGGGARTAGSCVRPPAARGGTTSLRGRAKGVGDLTQFSHEARTSLNAILGFCEMMETGAFGPIENAKYREYLKDIRTNANHLAELVATNLRSPRLGAQEDIALREGCVRLSDEVRAAAAMVSGLARDAGLGVTVSIHHRDCRLLADRTKLRQIAINLLSNAIKYSPRGGAVTIATRPTRDGGVALIVSDTGVGMSPAELERAFVPFVRHSSARKLGRPGTGLGLYLTQRLVAAHGGTIAIDSTPEHGTTVTVTFPAKRVTRCAVCNCVLRNVA